MRKSVNHVKNTYYTDDGRICRTRQCAFCEWKWWTLQYPENNIDPATTLVRIERWGKSTGSKTGSNHQCLITASCTVLSTCTNSSLLPRFALTQKRSSSNLNPESFGSCSLDPLLESLWSLSIYSTRTKQASKIDLFFKGPDRFWLAHNSAFDLGWLAAYGWHPKGQVRDSMLASRLLTNGITAGQAWPRPCG